MKQKELPRTIIMISHWKKLWSPIFFSALEGLILFWINYLHIIFNNYFNISCYERKLLFSVWQKHDTRPDTLQHPDSTLFQISKKQHATSIHVHSWRPDIMESLRGIECSASDLQDSIFESCVFREVCCKTRNIHGVVYSYNITI